MKNKQQILEEALFDFETSARTEDDYMRMMLAVKNAFSQGNGISGTAIEEALHDALKAARG